MARISLDRLRMNRPQVDRERIDATREADIRRHTVEDGGDPDAEPTEYALASAPAEIRKSSASHNSASPMSSVSPSQPTEIENRVGSCPIRRPAPSSPSSTANRKRRCAPSASTGFVLRDATTDTVSG